MAATHFRNCHLCEAMCGIAVDVEGGKVTGIRGDDADPFSRGHICPKAPAIADLHADPDRLTQPLRRTGKDFSPISWDEALDEAAARLVDVQKRHGRNAVASYLGNPTVHNHGAGLFAPLLLRALRSRSRYSATSADQLPHHVAAWFMLGHQLLLPVPDLDRARFFLMLGANPLASMGSLMTAPDIKERLRAMQARGGKLVVVDPRRTETARLADEHVFIRPGTDALFLLALVNQVFELGAPRLRHLEGLVRGVDAVRAVAHDFTPERVAGATGIPAETTRRIARSLWETDPSVVYGRVGASTQAFGGLCQWLIPTLNVLTGNFDRPGGAMLTRPCVDLVQLSTMTGVGKGSFGRWKSRVRGLPESGGELPVATLAEDMLAPGDGQIRALVTIAGNPVLSTPNGGQLDRALAGLDFMVSIDYFVNETTRHATLILPPVSPLERSHFDTAFHLLSIRNTAKWSPALFPKPAGAKHDWEILLGLVSRIDAHAGGLGKRLANKALERLGPDGLVNLLLRGGPWGTLRGGLSLARLKTEPHGIDLGPLTPCLPDRLPKGHRFVELAPEPHIADVARARKALEPAAGDGQLLLIGRRQLRSNNSWMHNVPKLMAGKPRCTLLVNPADATRLGLGDGQAAAVTSRVGKVEIPVEISDDVMPGVVSLPHGWGHGRPGVKLRVATQPENAGASLNDLTDELLVDDLCGNAAFSGVPVVVARV